MQDTVDNLTRDVLYHLYVQEHLSESEIARRFASNQVRINRLRKKWGIETLRKSDRIDLPGCLTPRQISILLGSMLGDGSLRRTGATTASYTEHHSEAQREWLDWKVREWGPFYLSTTPSDKGEHRGFRLNTYGCPHLFPYWEKFYPTGKGAKTFVGFEVDRVDALALAVWFLDDGSVTGSYVRFSVGPNPDDHKIQLRILRRFGLDPQLYKEGHGPSIHVSGRRSLTRFVDLVGPHVPPSMAYKLELKERKMGEAPRDLLTEERLRDLVGRGFSVSEIAGVFNVSRQSVTRAGDRFGLPRRSPGRPKPAVKSVYRLAEADELLRHLDPSSTAFQEDAIRILSRVSFHELLSAGDVSRDVKLLRQAKTRLEWGKVIGVTKAGSLTCLQLFPHRFDARYRDQPSVRVAWHDPSSLKKAVRFQIRVGDPVTTKRVFRALQATLRAPTNFRPCFAKALVEAYCPPEGLVLDPCAGYGGRACGTLAAGRRYVGVDPHPKASSAYASLQKALGGDLRFYSSPFEDVDLGSLEADMVLTSPPYFSVERYDDGVTQSWVRYKTWHAWLKGFLDPFVRKSWVHLRPGGVLCVNTKNVRFGSTLLPIADELRRLAKHVGFAQEDSVTLPLGRLGARLTTEQAYIFRKPFLV